MDDILFTILYITMTPLSERDDKIRKIHKIIENREKLLREIYKGIRGSTEENKYLKGIVDDYKLYYENIKKQKESQLDGLDKLHKYVKNISLDIKSTDIMLRQAQEDKKYIMKEINRIKREIENL